MLLIIKYLDGLSHLHRRNYEVNSNLECQKKIKSILKNPENIIVDSWIQLEFTDIRGSPP